MTDQKPNKTTPGKGSQLTSDDNTALSATAAPTFPVIGIVGAAGSRQALESFFRNLPDDAGMAFVVVTRLAAKQNSHLVMAIKARTDMPVVTAADGAVLQVDHVYIAPPGVQLTLDKGRFRLQNRTRTATQGPLDTFLTSLALDQSENAAATVFSGTGDDGIVGLQQVKAQGGLILVQEPDDAAHPALPRRGVATGVADIVGKASELAQRLVQVRGDLAQSSLAANQEQEESFSQIITAILGEIATQTGHDLHHYKSSTLRRRILRRMGMAGVPSITHYLDFLQANLAETTALFRDCLVSVTSFFRDPDAYEMLERDCIPHLFLEKGRSDFVRVWVAGCATGEEAYSVAIQLAERSAQVQEPPRLQVFATDLDEEAIAIARRGLYPAAIAKDIAPTRLQRYFSEEDGAYRVKPEIREHVLFAVHDLLKDPPFSRVDLICCRNVLIYFNREAQEKVFEIFHYALNPSKYLFLGTSESADAATELFAVLNKYCHLYQRRDVISLPQRRALGTPVTTSLAALGGKGAERAAQRQAAKPRTVEDIYTAWSLRAHTPPRLLVNDNYDLTHLFGGANRYLQEQDGAITQNILQKILPDLRLDLRTALYQAFNKRERTISRLLRVDLGNQTQMLQLHVGPVAEPGFPQEYVEVVFVVKEDAALFDLPATAEVMETDLSLVARMEEELLRTRERLQNIIEEYEVSSQELKASNEELQSINEELKSTTEELETSKEELQSMNEELITVNSELTHKIEELHRANSDLLNLITATDVGAIFLSNTLQIKRFTPRATDLFNLIESDINRPFAHVTHRLRHGGLPALAAHVNATTARIEETLQRDDDHWFILRIFPYRTVTGEIDGVIITFIDINDLKRAESEERQRRQQQSLVELSRQALVGGDLDVFMTTLTYQVAQVLDMELCKVLELQPDGTLLLKAGVGWQEGLVGQARVTTESSAQAGYTLQSHAPVVVRDLRTETRFSVPTLLTEHEVRSGMSVMIPTQDTPGSHAGVRTGTQVNSTGAYGVLGVHSRQPRAFATYDVDFLQSVANLLAATIARRRTEAAVRESEERFRSLIEQASDAILIANLDGVYTDVNSSACRLLGYERDELIGKRVGDLIPAQDQAKLAEVHATLLATPETRVDEWTLLRKDGAPILTEISAKILPNGIWQAIIRDITERKQTEVTLRRYTDMLRLSNDAIVVWSSKNGIEFWNQGAAMLYGYSAQEALGQVTHHLLATAHPQPWTEVLAELQRVGVWEGEVTHTTKTGRKLVVSTRHQMVEGADGNRAVLEINRDITAQKQTEADLRESEERFRIMADTAPVLIWVSGLDQGGTFFNKAWLEFTGRTMAQEVGVGWREGVHPEDYDRYLATYTTAFVERQSFEIEYRRRSHDGSYCWVLDKGAPRLASDGSFAGFIGGCIDIDDRKQAEAILARYQLLSNQTRDIILFMRLDGEIVEANGAAVEAYGYDRATLLRMKLHDLRDPATHAMIATQMAQADREEGGRGIRFETIHRRQDGRTFPVEVSSIGAEVGGERLLMSVIRDISERKAVEAALAASEAKFSTAFSLSPLFLTITSLADGRLIEVNEGFVTLTGYTRAEAVGRTPDELGLWVNPQERTLGLARLTTDGIVKDVEADFRMKDGSIRTCLLGASIIEINGQSCALTALTDITERKAAEETIQHQLAEIEAIYATTPIGLCLVDRDLRYVRINQALAIMNQRTIAAQLGRTLYETGTAASVRLVAPLYQQVIETGQPLLNVEIHEDTTEDPTQTRDWLANYYPLKDETGAVVGVNAAILEITERKQAEEALRQSEERFATIFRRSPYPIAILSLEDGCYVDVNPTWERDTGYTLAQAVGRTPRELNLQAEPPLNLISRLRAEGAMRDVEIQISTRNGQQRTALMSAELIELGAKPYALLVFTDITQRKQAEAALRTSEDRLQRVLDSLTAFAGILTPDGQIIDINRAAREIANLDLADLSGVPFEEGYWFAYSPALQAQIRDSIERAAQGATLRFDIKARIGADQFLDVDYAIAPVRDSNGNVTHLVPSGLDITERKQAEQALQASVAQLHLVTDNTSGLISYVDREQRYRFVNAIYEAWFVQPRTQILGCTVHEVLGDAYSVAQPHIIRALAGERVTFENTITYPDGVTRTVLTTYVPDVDAQATPAAQVLGFYALVTDITERKQAEERLHFLAEASSILASSLEYTLTLENVAHAAVPSIADWCAIDLVAEDGSLQDSFIAHVDPAKVRWAKELRERYPIDPNSPAGAPHVIRTGQSEFYPEITDAMLQAVAKNDEELQLLRSVGYRSIMIVPLQTHGRILGAITFVAAESERAFTADDLTMAEELSRRAAGAIGNAQLHRAVQQREHELHVSEERLRLATEAGKIGIYDHDVLAKQTTYSDIYLAITGIKPDEHLTRDAWLTRVHPDDRTLVAEKLQRAITYGESYDYEYRIYRPDGTLRWLGINSRASLDEAGRTVRLTGALSDITERKQAEEEIQRLNRDLKRRLDELQSLLDVAPIGIFVAHDPACELITSNAVGAKMLGIQPVENASKSAPTGDVLPFRVFRNGHELAPNDMPMQIAVQHDIPVLNWEVDVVHADGRIVNLYEYAMPLHDEEGKVRGCLGIFVDITERRQAEESLRESEERFRIAFEQAAVGMAHVSLDGRYLRVNDRLCAILGYQREELLQKKFLELTHPDDRATSVALSESLVANLIPSYSTEKRYLCRDGSMTWVNLTASVVRDTDGEVKYRLAVIEDISARKAAEAALRELTATLELRVEERTAELERSNQELDQFAYVASHDLKAPLRAIVNLSSWISEDAGAHLPPPSLEHLEKLRGRALRMERLLDDLLEYSRIGRRDGLAERVKSEALIQDVVYLLAPPPGFQVILTSEMPVLVAPRTPLELVFRNLIGNAIKHHHQPARGEVRISARDLGAFVEFCVSDNGPGIDPQYHERIFGMFQVLRPRDEVEGSGMGLAIVKKTIESRKGEVRVESVEGKGTAFYFTWPKGLSE